VIEPTDTDGDGIPDVTESEGFRDGFGHWYTTDPNDPDTDGDGLSDGEEAGELVEVNGRTYFKLLSDPTLVDSDGDWLWDNEEIEFGTNPLNSDTDKDTIPDAMDLNPLSFDEIETEPTVLVAVRDIIIGAVFGETGIEGGVCYSLVGDEIASSPFYLIGWVVGGLCPLSDLRDALQCLGNLDMLGVALSAVGAIPLAGDVVKTSGIVGKFILKYGDDAKKISKIAKYVSKFLLQHAPDSVSLKVLDVMYDGAATTLKRDDIPVKNILSVVENSGRIGKTLNIIKDSSGKVRWLEEGTATWGWTHIKRPDRLNQITKKFGPKTEQEIQEMVFSTIKSPDIIINNKEESFKYTKEFFDKDGLLYGFSVVVSDRPKGGIGKGNVVTAFPEKIK